MQDRPHGDSWRFDKQQEQQQNLQFTSSPTDTGNSPVLQQQQQMKRRNVETCVDKSAQPPARWSCVSEQQEEGTPAGAAAAQPQAAASGIHHPPPPPLAVTVATRSTNDCLRRGAAAMAPQHAVSPAANSSGAPAGSSITDADADVTQQPHRVLFCNCKDCQKLAESWLQSRQHEMDMKAVMQLPNNPPDEDDTNPGCED